MKPDKPKKPPANENVLAISLIIACCFSPILFILLSSAGVRAYTGEITGSSVFFVVILVFIGYGLRKLYFSGQCCEPNQQIDSSTAKRKQRIIFWIASFLIVMFWFVFK